MKQIKDRFRTAAGRCVLPLLVFTVLFPRAQAQATASSPHPTEGPVHTLHLKNAASTADQNEILTAIRNTLAPSTKIFLVPGSGTIVMRGSDEEFGVAEKLIAELDQPHHLYRLTFAVKDSDQGKQIGIQHFSVVVAAGQRVQFKEGSRVPVVTGSYGPPTATTTPSTQFTYIDVGMNFDATIAEQANGLSLRSKVERSSLAEEKGAFGKEDPIIRQSTIEGTSLLTLNKPLSLGSLAASGSTRNLEIEVTAELMK